MTVHSARIARALTRFETLHPAEIDLGLERIAVLLHKLGSPQLHLPPVVHVAGTNGKGSVIAMLGAMAEAAGLRAHIHTSPHLHRLNERFVLGGTGPMADAALADVLEEVETANNGAPATQYELLSAAMFTAFARTPADVALIEVGLGGEFDATNVVARPVLCLITPIAQDHANYLGEDIENIARAKAGIIKPGAPVLSARQAEVPRRVIAGAAARVKTSVRFCGKDFQVRTEAGHMVYEDDRQRLDLPLPGLRGLHQVKNAALAIATARALDWPHAAIAGGLLGVKWPGRLQVLARGKLAKQALRSGAQILVDGAHNPHAAQALCTSLESFQERDSRPLILIVGLQSTKDAGAFFAALAPLAANVICVPVTGAPHPMRLAAMQAAALHAGLGVSLAESLQEGLQRALRVSGGPRICLCGSLYLAAQGLAMNQPERVQ